MRKFRLIKEYPGSPELGAICEERNNKSSFCYYYEGEKNVGILKNEVENQPEYWEEVVENIYYLVCTEEETPFNAWELIRVETCSTTNTSENRKFFKTKEDAIDFIFYNKPCLSYSDVKKNIHVGYSTERILTSIHNTVNERI